MWLCVFVSPSTHVLTEDVVYREVTADHRLLSRRLLMKTNRLPRWAERLFPAGMSRSVYIIEDSIVDPVNKSLTTYTWNLNHTTLMVRLCVVVVFSCRLLVELFQRDSNQHAASFLCYAFFLMGFNHHCLCDLVWWREIKIFTWLCLFFCWSCCESRYVLFVFCFFYMWNCVGLLSKLSSCCHDIRKVMWSDITSLLWLQVL